MWASYRLKTEIHTYFRPLVGQHRAWKYHPHFSTPKTFLEPPKRCCGRVFWEGGFSPAWGKKGTRGQRGKNKSPLPQKNFFPYFPPDAAEGPPPARLENSIPFSAANGKLLLWESPIALVFRAKYFSDVSPAPASERGQAVAAYPCQNPKAGAGSPLEPPQAWSTGVPGRHGRNAGANCWRLGLFPNSPTWEG